VSRDKQIPCAFQVGMYRRMSVFSTSSVVAKIHAPQTPLPVPALQSPVECLLRTQQSCRRAACHGDPTCPVLVVSTFVLKSFPSIASNHALRPHPSSASTGSSCWCSRSNCTHLGLEGHVEERRRDGDHVGERQEGGTFGPAEVFVSLNVHV